ncbi:HNH endonuclease [Deinococcus antarcticus]|uniref:HNH endonuclease n=1 Tax=Deinococcus antarcticus TaxID=1298767 RepID=A0ABV8A234_9DEIO
MSVFCRVHRAEQLLAVDHFAVDHVVPLSNGGLHVLENLVIACQPCNRAKGDLSLDES